MAEDVLASFSQVDIIVNNAGTGDSNAGLDEIDTALWDRIYAINIRNPFFLVQRIVRDMIAKKIAGCIVNIASTEGKTNRGGSIVYSSSKAALISLTQGLAMQLAPYDIRVNAVCPGLIDTPIWHRSDKAMGMEPGRYRADGGAGINRIAAAQDRPCRHTRRHCRSSGVSMLRGCLIHDRAGDQCLRRAGIPLRGCLLKNPTRLGCSHNAWIKAARRHEKGGRTFSYAACRRMTSATPSRRAFLNSLLQVFFVPLDRRPAGLLEKLPLIHIIVPGALDNMDTLGSFAFSYNMCVSATGHTISSVAPINIIGTLTRPIHSSGQYSRLSVWLSMAAWF